MQIEEFYFTMQTLIVCFIYSALRTVSVVAVIWQQQGFQSHILSLAKVLVSLSPGVDKGYVKKATTEGQIYGLYICQFSDNFLKLKLGVVRLDKGSQRTFRERIKYR